MAAGVGCAGQGLHGGLAMTADATTQDAEFITAGGLQWRRWPTSTPPTDAECVAIARAMGPEAIKELYQRRETAIGLEERDPLNHGWESPCTGTLRELLAGTYVPGKVGTALVPGFTMPRPSNDVLELGGNGSGKTRSAARLAMEMLRDRPRREIRCYSQNEMTSIRYQQTALYGHLPPELRKVKKQGQTTKISYSEATGFSDSIFILPNHSTCLLLTYKGWMQDKTSAEGGEADLVWCDEEVPAELADTLRFRVHKKVGGVFLATFTPISGYTAAAAQYIEGAEILETIPARRVVWDWRRRTFAWGEAILPQDRVLVPGCPPGHVPYVLRSSVDRRYCVLFPTVFNPYTNVEGIIQGALGKALDFALERVFGWPTKRAQKAFPRFGREHIVKPDRIPKEGTNYLFCDPHGKRNWFMVWLRVCPEGRIWVYREWPGREIGEWAVPGEKPDGKEGPAQRYQSGMTFNDYKRVILRAEGWSVHDSGLVEKPKGGRVETIFERHMDPRPAATTVPSDEQAMTYLDYMQQPTADREGRVLVPGLDFEAAPACAIEEGTQLINDWISAGWDPQQPLTPLNCPTFYVSEECENVIFALRTWTGQDGEKGASKDPVDCLRGAAKRAIAHYDAQAFESRGGGSY